MDILTNTEMMNQENIADGYNIFTGDVDETHKSNRNYGEIHTGDEWIPARDRYCRPHARGSMRNGIIDDTKCQSEERMVTYFCCCASVALHWVVRSCNLEEVVGVCQVVLINGTMVSRFKS